MKHTRRGFFATLIAAAAAPLVAKVTPKRKTTGGLFNPHADVAGQWARDRVKIFNAMREGQNALYFDPAATPMLEVWPKPMTAAQLIKNAIDQINDLQPARDQAATFAEVNAMLDKWGATCLTNGPDRLHATSDSPPL